MIYSECDWYADKKPKSPWNGIEAHNADYPAKRMTSSTQIGPP
jgi:hypothetical protein